MIKKNKLPILILALGIVLFAIIYVNINTPVNSIDRLKELHAKNIEKNPFKETLKLSKNERKSLGIPPNKYNEEQWILTMNPKLGRPTPIKVAELQKELLLKNNTQYRTPGDASDNKWINRGPDNVAGRTRAIMFDPNDTTDNTVFAGSVSGGLWKNTNISDENSVWTRVDIPENLAVSSITFDPNNPKIFYVGTGESYVGHTDGSVNGDGIWKSIDGGNTWTNIFGGNTGVSYFVSSSNITVTGSSQVNGNYQSFPTANFGSEITSEISGEFTLANGTVPFVANNGGTSTEPNENCGPSTIDLTGKIALIRRGVCSFVEKVKSAQNAGAIAVIMMNNVSGEPIPMGGEDATITIPSVMISKEDGDKIEAAIVSGSVSGSLNPASGNFTATVVPGIQHINDIKIKDNDGVSEIYVAAADALYGASNSATTIGGLSYGLYKSTDGGNNWLEINLPLTADGNKHCPNDIEIGSDGQIWLSTTTSKLFNDGGGEIFSSTDGIIFTKKYTVPDGVRTQIAISSSDAQKIYVLAELAGGGVSIKSTTDAFNISFLTRSKTLPNDADTNITAADFTRGQAFYDLMLEVDPNNDDILYIGGIDLFKSTDGASEWSQISHWYAGFGFQYVHADQHIAAFGHNDSNKVIFGHDGGVSYSADGGTTIVERTKGLITSQYYTVGVGPTTAFTGDYFAGGLQDNGTLLIENAKNSESNSSTEIQGGDGAYTFFDQDGSDRYIVSNYVYNDRVNLYNFDGDNVTINNEDASAGSFINPQALDSNLDILYSNYTSGPNVIIKRYSGIKSQTTLTKTDLTDDLLIRMPTAFTVSPHTKSSSTLLVGSILGDVLLVENADTETPIWTGLDDNIIVGSISDLEFGVDENNIFVTVHNYGVNNIWYTNDKGITWQAKDGNLPDLPVKAILQNPLNLEEVIIGTELGIWSTTNFSALDPKWETSSNGMSNVKVLDLDLRNDNMVFAATHGRGVFSGMFTAESLSVDNTVFTSSELNVYPTISNGIVNITSQDNIGKTKINVYSITGKSVYSDVQNLSSSKKTLNLEHLNAGLYLIKFSNGSKKITKKIIIE
ncbi:PA domain-containing protein [uncultured Polaribacter sp.]|uniref:PA domain-containing protein n=1 Tax=uncultured Polaribacter sp. TaxID=174711 RepID=UPI0026149480|nr:PA domain-containing protein [uncultured Polaribacter sp.]